MQLDFEVVSNVGVGNYPDVIHFANTQAQTFYIRDGELFGTPSDKINYGEWENAIMQSENDVSPDTNMSHFEVKVLPGWGIVGGYKAGDTHKLIIYEFAYEMDRYLNSGSIRHSIDNPISSFSLSLENPDIKDPEKPGNVVINEENSLLSPGAKVRFIFSAGDSDEYELGVFYIDRSNFTLMSETASVDGRNTIGKTLKDQTVDETNEYWYDLISNHLNKLLKNANLSDDNYLVENTDQYGWFNFSPTIDYMRALETMLEVLPQWKIKELEDGTIVIGSPTYAGFPQSGVYTFYRNKDIFSRQITRDDEQAYNRVCVHTENYGNAVFRDVKSFKGWNLQANKTLYVQVANGLKQIDLENYADELALRLEDVGKVESFVGPFRPHLQCGDEAVIVGENGSKSLGLITEIEHPFGKNGFYTDFTVDSGGTVGKGRLSDFISKIAVGSMAQKIDIGWSDVDREEYANIAKYAKLSASSESSPRYHVGRLTDSPENLYDDSLLGWRPDKTEQNPFVVLDFGQKCIVDKIVLLLGRSDTDLERGPEWYKIQYWNGGFWIDLVTVEEDDILQEMTHSFEEIETSRIRIVTAKLNGSTSYQNWREVQIFGYM